MLITLSGLPGSGTSTAARLVAAELGLDHVDGGTIFRGLAEEAGLGLADFSIRAEADERIDRALDDRLTQRARRGHVVLESRLAGWLAHRAAVPGLLVWVHCDEDERALRVARRDAIDAAAARLGNRAREASESHRYRGYYGIDIGDRSIYTLVVDSTTIPPGEVAAAVIERARSFPAVDRNDRPDRHGPAETVGSSSPTTDRTHENR